MWSNGRRWEVIEATVAGEDVTGPTGPLTKKSDPIDLYGYGLVGLILPTLTSTDVTFEVCDTSDGTFVPLKSKAAAVVTITATTGGFAVGADDLEPLKAYRWVKVVCANSQATSRVFKFIVKV